MSLAADLIARCKRQIDLVGLGWKMDFVSDPLQASKVEEIKSFLEEGKDFRECDYPSSKSTMVSCNFSLYWILTTEELDRLEKEYAKI